MSRFRDARNSRERFLLTRLYLNKLWDLLLDCILSNLIDETRGVEVPSWVGNWQTLCVRLGFTYLCLTQEAISWSLLLLDSRPLFKVYASSYPATGERVLRQLRLMESQTYYSIINSGVKLPPRITAFEGRCERFWTRNSALSDLVPLKFLYVQASSRRWVRVWRLRELGALGGIM